MSNNKHHRNKKMTVLKNKRTYILSFMGLLMIVGFIGFNFTNKIAMAEEIMVYKSPTCGCCKKWVTHLEEKGFDVKTKDMADVRPIKNKYGVEQKFQSCHTAKIGKYFIEGHVPAKDIKRMLKEKPDIKGLSVPGMVMGSPGMEGHRSDKYNVLAIDENNNATVYSQY